MWYLHFLVYLVNILCVLSFTFDFEFSFEYIDHFGVMAGRLRYKAIFT